MIKTLQSAEEEPGDEVIDWRKPIRESLSLHGCSLNLSTLKDYVLIDRNLYRHLHGGVLEKCIGDKEAEKELECTHKSSCGEDCIVNLSRSYNERVVIGPT